MTRPRARSRFVSLLSSALLFCGAGVAAAQAPDPGTERVVINFRPVVGSRAFACGVAYDHLGASAVTFSDFRLYVHDARLVRRDGSEAPVSLEQDGLWQYRNVALLDFENGEGSCSNGTPDVRSFIAGTVPKGEYVGIRFAVGVPSDLNHLDVTRAPSPLTLTAMYWSWNTGYIFMRVEYTHGGSEGFFHLGSMRCASDRRAEPDSCALPNRPAIALREFDPRVDAIDVDLEALLRPVFTSSLRPQCMSEATPSCASMFAALGLAQGSRAAEPQLVFRAVHNTATRGGDAAKPAGRPQ